MPLRSFLILVAICLVWALNLVVMKIAVGDLRLPPVFLAGVRSAVVAAVLVPWIRPAPRPFGKLLLTAVAIGGGAFALLFAGLQTATPSAAAIVGLLGAPVTVLLAILFLGERIGWRRAGGILLTLTGVAIVLGGPGSFEPAAGLGLVALSAVVGACGAILLKQLAATPLQLQAWSGLAGAALLIPLSLAIEEGQVEAAAAAGWGFVAVIAFSALIVSVVAHTAYYALLQRHDANLVAPLTLMSPAFAVGLGVAITGDEIGGWFVAGALVALAGVLVIAVRPSRKVPKPLLTRPRL